MLPRSQLIPLRQKAIKAYFLFRNRGKHGKHEDGAGYGQDSVLATTAQLKRNIIANYIGRGWKAIMAVAFVPVYIKFLGVEAYGLIGVFISLVTITSVADFGLSTTLNREFARLSTQLNYGNQTRDILRTVEAIYWALGILIGTGIFFLAPPIAYHWIKVDTLSPSTVYYAIVVMGFVIALNFPFTMYSGGLLGLQRQTLLNAVIVVSETLRVVGAILILWLVSPTIHAFFIWQIIVNIGQTSFAAKALWSILPRSNARPRFKKEILSSLWRFSTGVTSISILALILTQVDKIILSKMLTLESFGYYTLAWTLAGSLWILTGPIFNAVFPRFTQLAEMNDKNELRSLYHKSCQFISVAVLPITMIVALFAPEILGIWIQNPAIVQHASFLVSLLIIGSALNGLMNIPYALQLAHGWTRLAFFTNVVSVIVLIPLIFILTSNYGARGGALAWLILNAGYVLITLQIMHGRLLKREQWRWYGEDVGRPLAGAFSIALIARMVFPKQMTLTVSAAILLMITIIAYLMAAWFTSVTRGWIKRQFAGAGDGI